ncbi:MAG: hypothetical protein AAGE52_04995 [Myxococcota bacterium]
MKLDGTQLDDVLALIGTTPVDEDTDELKTLEAALGQRLPEESRAFLRARPTLDHPHAEGHPEIDDSSFAHGLPNVDEWLSNLAKPLLGRYLATMHLIGIYPVGVQVNRGDFMYAGLVMEPYAEGVGGVMYYDEREIGTWRGSVSAFLHQEVVNLWEAVEEELEDLEDDERKDYKPDFDDFRDVFAFEGFCMEAPPEGSFPKALNDAWNEHWRARMPLTRRWWVSGFLRGDIDRYELERVPRIEDWEDAKETVSERYADAMYWLLAHAILGNEAELEDCLARTKDHAGTFVQALREAAPGLVARFAAQRETLFEVARKAG